MSHKEISFLLVTNCTQPRKQSGTSTLRYNIKGNRRCKQIQSLRKLAWRLIQRRNENVSDKYKMRKLRGKEKCKLLSFLFGLNELYAVSSFKKSHIFQSILVLDQNDRTHEVKPKRKEKKEKTKIVPVKPNSDERARQHSSDLVRLARLRTMEFG